MNIGYAVLTHLFQTGYTVLTHLFKFKFKSAWEILNSEKANSIDDFFKDDFFVFFGEILAYLGSVISRRSTNPEEKGMLK